ncbi:hypothetical protein EWB00_003195 [Schistosoma japonicum]|uniref:Uncharacterized protein n=1 Tax=Schistosoma japonicum TaxID=6182 RepID=A0A4Z2D982_SCHJA|nr:hypothetical protein EWB00_003195 [Schistosoma japonicum]TNN13060.1 hypothetical protein EWB00_003195 [Schistosoma japonicum]TNN13061.1 hypothetical protein EWB00_003195 [Schistosoma japonicum]TNN13062.1 hypothetical protein EWB00_003195 [Schistosoma japonicum]TNN13063.1 hypothetical protein EWB00_003195 [Schistosoma japonicum]
MENTGIYLLQNSVDVLGEILLQELRLVNADFDSTWHLVSPSDLDTRFMLMIDKSVIPKADTDDLRSVRSSWVKVAATAAAYVYKSVGESVSRPLRKWLANAASTAILSGMIAQVSDSSGSDEQPTFDGEPLIENISTPDKTVENHQDGAWYYGSWTMDNIANSCEMKDVINAEMSDACIHVMVASVVNYFQENSYTPNGLLKDSYACKVLKSDLMDKYGLTDECDKIEAMRITGRWVSKLYVYQLATKHRDLQHPIRPISNIGLVCPLKVDISNYLNDLPASFIRTRIAHQIASRMVRSVCIVFFEDLNELIELKKLYREICNDPFHYHSDCEYLTNSPGSTITDRTSRIFGRLVTYLSIFEPNSELFSYSYLKTNGITREKHYGDYSKNWENILKVIYDELYMPSGCPLVEILKSKCKIPDNIQEDNEMLRHCWNEYGVDTNIQQFISRYTHPHLWCYLPDKPAEIQKSVHRPVFKFDIGNLEVQCSVK